MKDSIKYSTIFNLIYAIKTAYLWPRLEDFLNELDSLAEESDKKIIEKAAKAVWKQHEG